MKKLLAECIGTYALVFAGTGAIVVNHLSHGAISHTGISLTFGLIVMAMIHTVGDISGAHLNPAVTLGFASAGRMAWHRVPGYLLAQTAGALLASTTLRILFPTHSTLGATQPAGSSQQSLVLELILTLLLMLVILRVSTGEREKGLTAGLVIGGVVALEALFAGPICGASMNPARSLGPALISGHLEALWLYILGPTAGALLAVPLARALEPNPPSPHSPTS